MTAPDPALAGVYARLRDGTAQASQPDAPGTADRAADGETPEAAAPVLAPLEAGSQCEHPGCGWNAEWGTP